MITLVQKLDKSSGLLVDHSSGDMIRGNDLTAPQPLISPLPNPVLAAVALTLVNTENDGLTCQHC